MGTNHFQYFSVSGITGCVYGMMCRKPDYDIMASALLELDEVVGNKPRQWLTDTDPRWRDRFVLTGTQFAHSTELLWRFSPSVSTPLPFPAHADGVENSTAVNSVTTISGNGGVTLQPVLFDTTGTAEGALTKCSLFFLDGSVLAPTAQFCTTVRIFDQAVVTHAADGDLPCCQHLMAVVVAVQLKSDDGKVPISNFSTRHHDQAFGWPPTSSCKNLSNPQCRNYSYLVGSRCGFGGPAMVSHAGVLLVVFDGHKCNCADFPGQHDILCQRSTDFGMTFGKCGIDLEVVNTAKQWGASCGGPTTMCSSGGGGPVVDKTTGTISVLFAFENTPGSTNTTIWSINSTDLGELFSKPRHLPIPRPVD